MNKHFKKEQELRVLILNDMTINYHWFFGLDGYYTDLIFINHLR